MMTVKQVTRSYSAANEQAARIITQDAATYPVGSLAQQWALLVLAKMAPTIRGPLFKAAA